MTAEGEVFLPAARRVLEEARSAEASVGLGSRRVRGVLRVTAPAAFGRKVIAPLAPALLAAHPDLRLDLQLTDSRADLVEEGLDLAVRIADALPDSRALARKLAENPVMLVASPSYLARRTPPRDLAALSGHDCLTRTGADVWSFQNHAGAKRQIRVGGPFSSNAFEALREAVLGGAGVGLHSHWDVADEIADGRLRPISLADAAPTRLAVWLLRPAGTPRSGRKVEVFVDALRNGLAAIADRTGAA